MSEWTQKGVKGPAVFLGEDLPINYFHVVTTPSGRVYWQGPHFGSRLKVKMAPKTSNHYNDKKELFSSVKSTALPE